MRLSSASASACGPRSVTADCRLIARPRSVGAAHRGGTALSGQARSLTRRGQVLRQQPCFELVAIACRDASQGFVVAEELGQIPARLLPDFQRCGLHVWAGENVGSQELAQVRPLGGFDQADRVDGDVSVGEADAFATPADFRPDDHVEARPWLLGDEPPVTVGIAVDAAQRDAMLAQLGSDATVVEGGDGGHTLIELVVTNRSAFRAFLLGFLEHARVVEPSDVRADMVAWLERIATPAS